MADALDVLVVSFGGPGDTYPMLALAIALRNRRHRVRFVANSRYESLAGRYGIDFVGHFLPERAARRPASSRWSRLMREAATHSWLHQALSRDHMRKRSYLGRMRWLFQFLADQPDPRRAIVVTRTNSFGARIAQECLGVPVVTVQLQPSAFRSLYDAPGFPLPDFAAVRRLLWSSIDVYLDRTITPSLNRFRSELGLRPVQRPFRGWVYSPDLVIGLFPVWFASPQPDWPPNTHLTGFALFDESGNWQTPAELESFLESGDAPIVFTRGSQSEDAYTFFETSVEICRRLARRGLLLARQRNSVPNSLPEYVRHFEYIPLSVVLPRAAAIVHHGGLGTTAQAFAAGVPQIAVPLFDDQPDNAARVQRLGAGIRLSAMAYRPREAARQMQSLLDSKQVGATCRKLANAMRDQNPLADACQLIESLR